MWVCPFAVSQGGTLLGVQPLESVDWTGAREVDCPGTSGTPRSIGRHIATTTGTANWSTSAWPGPSGSPWNRRSESRLWWQHRRWR